VPYRVVQPWGKDRTREATEVFTCATLGEAYAEVDRYGAHVKTRNVPGDHLELLVVDEDGREVARPGTH
jgi:hypothetical protein